MDYWLQRPRFTQRLHIELPTCGRNHQMEHVMRTNRRKLVTSSLRAAIGGVFSGAAIFRVRDARLRSQCLHRRKARSAPTAKIYEVTDRLHEGRTVHVPCHEIATTVSAWLAEFGADSPLVEDLARAVGAGDWRAADVIGDRLSVVVTRSA